MSLWKQELGLNRLVLEWEAEPPELAGGRERPVRGEIASVRAWGASGEAVENSKPTGIFCSRWALLLGLGAVVSIPFPGWVLAKTLLLLPPAKITVALIWATLAQPLMLPFASPKAPDRSGVPALAKSTALALF
ncbi:hypothetical protein [Kamptonema formosum]|uniref:hypothetical protein n=1 Tax=Kamptonema formosum TaxID=331992 RepID=UPI00034BC43E|nr:hypothetical protein [Oscillatoria sp. PCC 10802]